LGERGGEIPLQCLFLVGGRPMLLSQISINQDSSTLNHVNQTTFPAPRELRTDESKNPTGDKQAESVSVNKIYTEFNKLEGINNTVNQVATNIRIADCTMEVIEKQVSRMHEKLKVHVKNFPPFLPGSEERVKLLRSFNSFRKQIDKMTVPPEYEYAAKIMADPSKNPDAGPWEIIIHENGPFKTIQNKEIHTGSTGLDIPELPENASDDTINEAISRMNHAKEILKRAQVGLVQDIAEIGRFKISLTHQEDIPELTTESKSIEIGQTLAGESGMRLTEATSQLINLLNE